MLTAASERPRHTFAVALRGAGLLDKKQPGKNKEKDVRMVDVSGQKRTPKTRSHKARNTDNVKDPGVTAREAMLAAKASLRSAVTKVPLNLKSSRKPARSPVSSLPIPAHSIAVWKEFVQKRWNPQAQFLNLESVGKDEMLRSVRRDSDPLAAKEAAVLFKLASKLQPEVHTVSLANNGLTNANILQALHHYLPGIRHLSLAHNNLRALRNLDYMSAGRHRFLHLKELVLSGNPMRQYAVTPEKLEQYKTGVLRRFPTLELLDLEVVPKTLVPSESSTPQPSTSQGPTSFPLEMRGGLITPGMEGFVAEFLTRYFTLYDTARSSLGDVYAPNATFSYTAHIAVPPRARNHHYGPTMPNQRKLEWTPWTSGSRNSARSSQQDAHNLYIGTNDVMRAFLALPGTKHDISAAGKFVVDASPIQGILPGPAETSTVLLITVHGQFEEEPSHGVRSFDRTLILAPSPHGSRAQMAGWPALILSDELVVRVYSSHEAWAPGPIGVSSSLDTPSPALPAAAAAVPGFQPLMGPGILLQPEQQIRVANDPILAALPDPQQRAYVIELSARTGLNANYSIQCLEGNRWDPQQAMANFEAVRAQVPQEAFAL